MSGVGVALVPALAVAGDLERGSLALVGLRADLPTIEWGVVTTGRERSPVVDQLVTALATTSKGGNRRAAR
jgi:DNA-binding transcriptional LysR family regulator